MQSLDTSGIAETVRALVSQVGTATAPGLAVRFTWVRMTGTAVTTGRWFVGTRTLLSRQAVNSDAGLNQSYQFSVVCDASQFGQQPPAPKDRIAVTMNGASTTYKVLSVDSDAIGATVRLHLGSEYDR
jgi:hypothetical protein